MAQIPARGLFSLAPLIATVALAAVRRSDTPGHAIHRWLRRQIASTGSPNFLLRIPFRPTLIVTGAALSAQILEPPPSSLSIAAGSVKRSSMGYLAPHALTISDDDEWSRRRVFNEQVLGTGHPHEIAETILRQVNEAFGDPVTTPADVQERMGRVMLGVVFGSGASPQLLSDLDELMSLVKNPLRRALLGRFRGKRRSRFYAELRRQWDRADDLSLVAIARAQQQSPSDESLEQIPHWMFTFTGSGTDLLVRTLALVGARPPVCERLAAEISGVGGQSDPAGIRHLEYLEACLREVGRLYPPVTTTFHSAPNGVDFDGQTIAAGTEMLHYFPTMQRDTLRDATADDFRPERWLGADAAASHDRYPNLFLSGARACPGQDLILFVCKSAIARQIADHGIRCDVPDLATDPLPFTFPAGRIRFGASGSGSNP